MRALSKGRTISPRLPSAFSLLEVVVSLSVVLILAAVALPSIVGFARQARVQATADLLEEVRDALFGNDSFNDALGRNAGRLSELSQIIVKNNASYATGTDDSCGDDFGTGEVNDWEDEGPFVNFQIARSNGMMTPIGRAEDSLTRIPNDDEPGVLRINFLNNIELTDAVILDDIVDGGNGNGTGTVQWVLPATDGVVTMHYFIPIDDEC